MKDTCFEYDSAQSLQNGLPDSIILCILDTVLEFSKQSIDSGVKNCE